MITRQIFLISFLTIFCGFNTTVVLADSVLPERSEIESRVLEAVKETTKNNPPKRQNNYDTKSFLKNKQRNKAQAFCIEWDNFIPKVLSGDKKLEIISIGNSWNWKSPQDAKTGAIKFCKKRMSGSSFNNKDPIVSDCKCEVLHLNNEFFLPASAKQVISTYIENAKTKLAAELASKKKEAETKLAAELASKKKEEETRLAAELASKKKEEEARLAAELASKKKEEETRLAAELASKKKEEETRIKSDFLEHVNMISDIENFSTQTKVFDVVKIGRLFVKFNNAKTKQTTWTLKTSESYDNLKKYALSFDEFANFRKRKEIDRTKTKNKLIEELSEKLKKNVVLLTEYVSQNLSSDQTPKVIEMIESIEEGLEEKVLSQLKSLYDKTEKWITVNLKVTKTEVDISSTTTEDVDTTTKDVDTTTKDVDTTTKDVDTTTKDVDTTTSDIAVSFELENVMISKEFGDGFSNFESGKNSFLVGVTMFLGNKSEESFSLNDLNFQLVFVDKKNIEGSIDATKALNNQEGLANMDTLLEPLFGVTTGVAFLVPVSSISGSDVLLEIWKDTELLIRSTINLPKQ